MRITCATKTILAITAAMVLGSVQTEAAFVHNAVGISSPVQTITFDEFTFVRGTEITNQYSSLGVTFPTALEYEDSQSFPNITGGSLWNDSASPVDIHFLTVQNRAAFSIITNPTSSVSPTIFSAYLGSTLVETFSASTDTISTANFFGFQGIIFDTIRIFPKGYKRLMRLDNIQTGTAAPVPEPASLAMWSLMGGIGIMVRRKRKATA